MDSKKQFGYTINNHEINTAVADTTLLVLPVMEDDISITLSQTGINSAVKVTFAWSNDGLNTTPLTDAAGEAIEIDWATTSSTVGIQLADVGAAWLHISLVDQSATAGTITTIQTKGLGGVSTDVPVVSDVASTGITDTEATVYAKINSYHFYKVEVEYGEDDEYGDTTTAVSVYKDGQTNVLIEELTAETEYHYRFKVTSVAGVTYSADNTFTTLAE